LENKSRHRPPTVKLVFLLQVEVKRALPKEVQQQQAALRAAVAGRGMIPTIGEDNTEPVM